MNYLSFRNQLFFPVATFFLSILIATPSFSESPRRDNFVRIPVNQKIGDGSNGRPFAKWVRGIDNRKVEKISFTIQRLQGGKDSYVNLRFEGGDTFGGGKRFSSISSVSAKTYEVEVNESPNGKPLIMTAYNGEFNLVDVTIIYNSAKTFLPLTERPRDWPSPRPLPGDSQVSGGTEDPNALAYCRDRDNRIRKPRIEIGEIESRGGLFSSKYKITGEVFGACIEEAGYFEKTRLKDKFEIPLSDRTKRYPFEVRVKSGKRGEIRVYTVDGNEEIIDVDEMILEFQRDKSLF